MLHVYFQECKNLLSFRVYVEKEKQTLGCDIKSSLRLFHHFVFFIFLLKMKKASPFLIRILNSTFLEQNRDNPRTLLRSGVYVEQLSHGYNPVLLIFCYLS